jgi:hypothetical protein
VDQPTRELNGVPLLYLFQPGKPRCHLDVAQAGRSLRATAPGLLCKNPIPYPRDKELAAHMALPTHGPSAWTCHGPARPRCDSPGLSNKREGRAAAALATVCVC